MKKLLMNTIRRALDKGRYEATEHGILIPEARAFVAGEYFHSVNSKDLQIDANLLTAEGLNYLVNVGFHTRSKINDWYVALFAGAIAPAASWKAANFTATASEIVSNTEGYTEVNRPRFQSTAAATDATFVDNLTGGKATFSIVTAGTLTITGAALLSDQLKGSTSGVLASATKFANARTLQNGDSYELGYRVTLNAA